MATETTHATDAHSNNTIPRFEKREPGGISVPIEPAQTVESPSIPIFQDSVRVAYGFRTDVSRGCLPPFLKGDRGGFEPNSVRAGVGEIPPLPPSTKGGTLSFRPTPLINRQREQSLLQRGKNLA
jgi:hypothetical protein